jgi:alpha-glucoside transport system substrate-binding protein
MNKRWLIAMMTAFALIVAACSPAADTGDSDTTDAPVETTDGDTTETTAGGDTTETTEAGSMEGPYEHLNMAYAGDFDGTEVTVQAQWTESEEEKIRAVFAPFEEATGITVNYEGLAGDHETVLTVRVDGDDAPDIAQIAQPGKMVQFAEEGKLVNLSDFINDDQIKTDYISSFTDLASYNGDTHGVFFKGDLKSIVWYPVQAFADNGYEVPATWDELIALSDQIVADGTGNPWCNSIESGDGSGWPATDWMEDIILRTHGVEVYDAWRDHTIPFNDPQVLEAAGYMSEIYFTEGYSWGGNVGINATWIGDIPIPIFTDDGSTECFMLKQAAWIRDFFTEGTTFPGDVDFFYLPPINPDHGTPVLGSGDMFLMFNDRPEVRALMEYFATPEAAKPWIDAGGFISPNSAVPLDWYSDYPNNKLAEIMNGASAFRFDASDVMPAEVGNGTFWSGMVDWVAQNGDDTEGIFQEIEDSWPAG